MQRPELMSKIKNAPMQAGCYLYQDGMGNVIYVGKAKFLKHRVRQYFQKPREDDNPKLENLVRVIADVEYQTAPTERDALMLEYRLIKRYRPWFNAQLVTDPRQLYLRIDATALRPTLTVSERDADDGAEYFGYFRDRFDAEDAINLLNAAWRTPVCGKRRFEPAARPCVQHEVGRCMAPCGHALDERAYRAAIDEIVTLLRGERTPVFARLEAEMKRQAAAMAFEKAVLIKHRIERLDRLRRRSRCLSRFPEQGDVLVFLRAFREREYSLFLIRDGAAVARMDGDAAPDARAFALLFDQPSLPDSAWLPGCLIELYADKLFVPLPADETPSARHQRALDGYARFAYRGSSPCEEEDAPP